MRSMSIDRSRGSTPEARESATMRPRSLRSAVESTSSTGVTPTSRSRAFDDQSKKAMSHPKRNR
jgi:hypothetical protein